jgi:hypothetical protein
MTSKRGGFLAVVTGALALTACSSNPSSSQPAPEMKDSEVRTYIRDELSPYLLLIAKELCKIKAAAASGVGVPDLCESVGDPEGVKPPPPNGNP